MSRLQRSLVAWRLRVASRRQRKLYGLVFLVGGAGWAYMAHQYTERAGRTDLLQDIHPGYLVVAGAIYWPAAILGWRLLFPSDTRPLPWADEQEPVRFLSQGDAELLAQRIMRETGRGAHVVLRGGHYAVDLPTPATVYRLTSEEQWADLRGRFVDT